MRTPITILSGYLGSGKTTLVQHILKNTDKRIAVVINEFGDIGVDTQTVKGENIEVKEILEGCVCCSLVGELDAAVKEIIQDYKPDVILVETTGIAEPDAIMVSIDEDIKDVKLDSVITVIDADIMNRFPVLNNTSKIQIEAADILILNKVDLVSDKEKENIIPKLREFNTRAKLMESTFSKVDVDLLFSVEAEHHITNKHHPHDNKNEYFTLLSKETTKEKFENFLNNLPKEVFRAKGYIVLDKEQYLMNYVAGRWTLDKGQGELKLIFIGEGVKAKQEEIENSIQ